MPSLTVASAELAGIVVESMLYGFYLVLFMGSIYAFINAQQGGAHSGNRLLLGVNIVLLILITTHWILQIIRLFDAFINVNPRTGRPDDYYSNVNDAKYVTKSALYFVQTIIGDLTMVYRLYVVWDNLWWLTLPPMFAIAAYFIGGIVEINYFTQPSAGRSFFDSTDHIKAWVMLMFISSLFVTFYVTGLITWRIWSLQWEFKKLGVPVLNGPGPVIQILIESAAIYTICHITYNIAFLLKSPFQLIALDAASPIIGIAFTLVIVRASLRQSKREYPTTIMPIGETSRRSRDYLPTHVLSGQISTKRQRVEVKIALRT